MAAINQISGMGQIIINLALQGKVIEKGVENGLKKAGLLLQRESQKMVPVEFGNLKASAYTRADGNGFSTQVTVGYTAAYALYVHEAVGMVLKGLPRTPNPPHKGRYWDPQGQASAKFLEEPARRLTPQLLKVVEDSAKIP